MKNWGKRVRKLRLEHKDTLMELAEKIGYDHSNLSKIERGLYKGQIDVFDKIAKVYGVDFSYFADTDEELDGFTVNEQGVLFEPELTPEALKKKYDFKIDGKSLTNEEIEQMTEYVRALRIMKQNQSS